MDLLLQRLPPLLAEAAPAALVLISLFLISPNRRRRDSGRSVLYLLFALYLCSVYTAAGLPNIRRLTYCPRVNLTPFAYLLSDRSSILNVLFFIPLGFLLPLIWTRFRAFYRTIPFGLGVSAVIEASQVFTYRATDVNDLMTNTLGTLVGYCLAMLLQWIFPVLKPGSDSRDVYWICLAVAALMFFVHPMLSIISF